MPPPDFAAELAMDRLTVSKGSIGKEFVVLLICNGFSNVMQAFPLTSKDHHAVKECLLKFVGTHKERGPNCLQVRLCQGTSPCH